MVMFREGSKVLQSRKQKKGDESSSNPAVNSFNFDKLYLATKTNFYQINSRSISGLTENLLFKNNQLSQELQDIYSKSEKELSRSKADIESNNLFQICIENSIDYQYILRILWNRIYTDTIAMRFISIKRYDYSDNEPFSKIIIKNSIKYYNEALLSDIFYPVS